MNLYLVRHGQSLGNVSPDQGHDPVLTELGTEQARQVGIRFANIKLDCIIASPLRRALATANEIAVRQPDGPSKVELLPDAMECGVPADFVPLPYEELLKICPTALPYTIPTPVGGNGSLPEEYGDLHMYLSRCHRIVSYLRRRFPEAENVALVAHGVFISRMVVAALRFPYPDHFNFQHDNTAVTKISYIKMEDHIHTRLAFLNDTSHLYHAGLSKGV